MIVVIKVSNGLCATRTMSVMVMVMGALKTREWKTREWKTREWNVLWQGS